MYKKRAGTSGIRGHLYETKLIALILYRLQHNDCIEDFCMVSNMDEIGAFDDICVKVKIKGRDQPIAIFVQVKHKENDDKFPTFDNKNESIKWLESLSKIKRKITGKKNQDAFFDEGITVSDCVFILYTNARCDFDSNRPYASDYDIILNKLLSTSATVGTLPSYTERHINFFGEIILKEDIKLLVEHFEKYLNENTKQSVHIMNDQYIQHYHVMLKDKVVEVTDIQTERKSDVKFRFITFREEFFRSDDKYTVLFRNELIKKILLNHANIRMNTVGDDSRDLSKQTVCEDDLISSFLANPLVSSLTPLIITHIEKNDNGQLEFTSKRSVQDTEKLRHINISQDTIDEAYVAAATTVRHYLKSLEIKVPIGFGNVDLTISGNTNKIDRRLNYLTSAVVDLTKVYEQRELYKVVNIDDSIDAGILSSNGGLASAVSNLLKYDETTKLLKFSNVYTPAQKNAYNLYLKISKEINDLHEYRFDVKTIKFPKVNFDCADVAREFFSKFVIFAKQSNHTDVEKILKNDIQEQLNSNSHNHLVSPESVFLHYHNEIQKWWMSSKAATYLTKQSDVYQQTVNSIVTEPHMSALQITFHISHLKYFGYSFTGDENKWIKVPTVSNVTFVNTNTVTLTTVKVIQALKNCYLLSNYAVLDLQCVINQSHTDFCLINAELRKTNKVIIVVCRRILNNEVPHAKLFEFAKATQHKQLFIVTSSALINLLSDFFPGGIVIIDETQTLSSLTFESQREVIREAEVLFQGNVVKLDLLIDNDVSAAFIRGQVLEKIMCNERIRVGSSLSNSRYEGIKHLYIDRRLREMNVASDDSRTDVEVVNTFEDIDSETVLVTAAPGMGKSTLLTHLSVNTKERDKRLWIVRVNLLDHSKQFYKWQKDKTALDILDILEFFCFVVTKHDKTIIYFKNGKVLVETFHGDEIAAFELEMFLHSYNERKLFFIFDGFDEICPHYKDTVLNFLNVFLKQPNINKMWVASRPYSDILPDLRNVFDRCFEIDHLNINEQEAYLERVWRDELMIRKLNITQQRNLKFFLSDISLTSHSSGIYHMYDLHVWIRRVFLHFYEFIHSHIGFFDLSQETLLIAKKYNKVTHGVGTLAGTPLLLYFIADYTVNVIDNYEFRGDNQVYMNVLKIYEMFVENKLKKVLFHEKNKMDTYNPDVIMRFERERAECIAMHKRLAAYALLYKQVYCGPNSDEFKEMDPCNVGVEDITILLNKIKMGVNKSGLISHITLDNVPVFIHRTFTEYFTAEYICDVLNNDRIEFEKKRNWLHAVSLCCDEEVFIWIRFKSKLDSKLTQTIRAIDNTESFILSMI